MVLMKGKSCSRSILLAAGGQWAGGLVIVFVVLEFIVIILIVVVVLGVLGCGGGHWRKEGRTKLGEHLTLVNQLKQRTKMFNSNLD